MKVTPFLSLGQLGKLWENLKTTRKAPEISQPHLDTHFTEWYRNRPVMEHGKKKS